MRNTQHPLPQILFGTFARDAQVRALELTSLYGWLVTMMDDGKLAAQALGNAQRILEEYLLPRPRTNERMILDRLVEVLDRPDLLAVVTRLQRGESLSADHRTTCTVLHYS